MTGLRALPALAFAAAVLVAVPALAAPQPHLYFLKDGAVRGAGDGILTLDPPPPPDLQNPANNSAPGMRMILPAQHNVAPVQFVQVNSTENTGRVWGPVIVALWAPKWATNQHGNITVSLVELKPSAVPAIGGGGRVLASASTANNYENTTLPNGTALMPPEPTNVTAALAHVQGQLLAYALTEALKPPIILLLDDDVKDYIIDEEVDPEARLVLRMQLDPNEGSALSPLGQPTAVGQAIQYDFGLWPSFVYIPWYAEDPPRPTPATKPAPTATTRVTGPTTPPTGPTGDGESTPGLAPATLVLALAATTLLLRRRQT